MSSALSKRQQARNERTLQDLIKNVPGNDRCADCGTRNPGWASWNLGVFLCVRCASIHRKLGTHITKIKSISMDSWKSDQIDTMRQNGNRKSNLFYNPDPSKHPMPHSSDSDSPMERWIRSKYEHQLFRRDGPVAANKGSASSSFSSASGMSASASFGGTGNNNLSLPSSSSSNASFSNSSRPNPPTRSVSAGFPSSRTQNGHFRTASPITSKAGQVLGMFQTPYADTSPQATALPPRGSVVFPHGMVTAPPTYDDQLKTLEDMGFPDREMNLEALKGTRGQLQAAVEILVRLRSEREGLGNTPVGRGEGRQEAGISIQRSGGSSNPFDSLDRELPPLPKSSTGGGGVSASNGGGVNFGATVYQQQSIPTNQYVPEDPWFQPQQPQQLQQQSYNVSYQSQPQANGHINSLPPEMGGFQQHQQVQPQPLQQAQNNPYVTFGGQVPQIAPNMGTYNPFISDMSQGLQGTSLQQANPYLPQQQQQVNTIFQNGQVENPYIQQFAQQQNFYQQQQQQQQQQLQQPPNPWATTAQNGILLNGNSYALQQSQPQQLQQNPYQAQQQQQQTYQQPAPQPLVPQRTGMAKSDILALYQYPHLAPAPSNSTPPVPPVPQAHIAADRSASAPVEQATPAPGSNNPFLPAPAAAPTTGNAATAGRAMGKSAHMSQESVDLGAWQNGRHSPDAFASLSFGQ